MEVNINLSKDKHLFNTENINKTRELEQNKELFDNRQIVKKRQLDEASNSVADLIHEQDLQSVSKNMPQIYNKPFTGELSRAIGLLANDRGKKSEYFAPVAELAETLLTKDLKVEERADVLSRLLEKAAYYLNNRKGSIFSRQRNRRRAACESVFSGAVKFLSDAPEVFWAPVNERVTRLLSGSPGGKQNQEAVVIREKLGYFLTDDFISASRAKESLKRLPDGQKDVVSDVLLKSEGIRSLLTNKMPPYPGPKADAEAMRAFEKEILATGIIISDFYRKLTASCDKALESPLLDEKIKKDITAIKNDAEHMGKVFANGVGDFLEGNKPDEDTTWQEALARKSTAIPQLRDKSVAKMGNGTSIVYKLKKDNETKFFKKDDLMAKDFHDAWTSIAKHAKEYPGYKSEYDEELEKLDEAMKAEMTTLYGPSMQSQQEKKTKLSKEENKFYTDVVCKLIQSKNKNVMELANKIEDEKILQDHPFLAALKEANKNSAFKIFAKEMLSDYLKKANAYDISVNAAKIQAGSNLSNRNVATYRMASLMGISRLVVRSDTADVYDGEKRIQGMMMEEAQGEEAHRLHVLHSYHNINYSKNTIADMLTMQVFDYICGQIDRNASNYFLSLENGCLTNLKMIDNDLAMGNLIPKKNIQKLLVPDQRVIRTMPEETKKKIVEIAEFGEDYLQFFFRDILETSEIKAALARLKYISNVIKQDEKEFKEQIHENKEQVINSLSYDSVEKWREADLSKDPELREAYYIHSLYQRAKTRFDMEKKTNKELLFIDFLEDYFKTRSYLNVDFLPTVQQMEAVIEAAREKWHKDHNIERKREA